MVPLWVQAKDWFGLLTDDEIADLAELCKRLFAEHAAKIGFVRYEDFAKDHEKELGKACRILNLPYDKNYSRNWQNYDNITGNVSGSRGGTSQIQILPRRHIPKHSADYLLANSDYRTTCELLACDL